MSTSAVGAWAVPARAQARRAVEVVWISASLQIRAQRHPTFLVLGLVQPAAFLLVTTFASRRGHGIDLAAAALGTGLIALWGATIWSAGSILRSERWQGTLPGIVSRPAGLGTVLLGKSLGATTLSTLFIGATVYTLSWAIGHPIPVEHSLAFVAALVAVFISATVLGLLLSCVFILTRAAPRISEALMYPVFIVGGMLVPVDLLPGWAQPLSNGVSLYWGSRLVKEASVGAPQRLGDWVGLALTTAAYALLARVFFSRVVDRARQEGSIDLY
jgi:ABC-2 type transport system permease protein